MRFDRQARFVKNKKRGLAGRRWNKVEEGGLGGRRWKKVEEDGLGGRRWKKVIKKNLDNEFSLPLHCNHQGCVTPNAFHLRQNT